MKKCVVVIVFLALFIGTACLTIGWNFPTEKVGQIKIGATTKTDLQAMFGEPYQQGLEDGLETWTYVWIRYSGKTKSKELYVKFQENGQVASYSFSSSLPGDKHR